MMSAAASITNTTGDLTTCPICLEVFDNPKSLPCIHGFCLKCLEGHFKDKCQGDDVPCPLCRKEFTIPPDGLVGLQHHFFLQHLVDARNSSSKSTTDVPCEVCSEENEGTEGDIPVATIYCVDCNEKLCERCSKPHRRLKRGAHQMRQLGADVETEMLHLRRTLCGIHDDEPVKLYCYECDDNVCLVCSSVTHKQHETAEIPDAAKTFSFQIDSDARRVSAQVQNIREKSRNKDKKKKEFISEVDRVKKEIEHAGDQIKGIVDNQVTTWLNETALVKSEDEKKAEMVEETYQLALVARESFYTYSRELLDKGRPSDITRAASELHRRATELLADDVTSVQYSPTHVTFVAVDVTQLTNVNLIGQVTVGDRQPISGLAVSFVPIDCRLKAAAETEKELMKQVSGLQEETRMAVQKENKTLENNISLEAQMKECMEKQTALNEQLSHAQSELSRIQTNENDLQKQLKERLESEESLKAQLAQTQLSEKRLQLEQLEKSESEEKLQQEITELQHRTSELERQLQEETESHESLSSQLKTTTESEESLKLQLKEKLETEEQLKSKVDELRQSEAKLNERVAELCAKETEMTQRIEKLSKSEQQFKIKLREEGERRSELQKRNLEMTEQELKQRPMGRVVQTLPEGLSVYGIAMLESLLYVLRDKSTDQVEVFDTELYRLQRCIHVPGLGSRDDLIACQHNNCLYLSDATNKCVHRAGLQPDAGMTQWPVNDRPARLSLTDTHCVLVTCDDVRKIKQFSSEGRLVRILSVPFVASPWHTIQLADGHFAVCHGGPDEHEHRVCVLGYDGHVVKSYGGSKGSGLQLNVPSHLAVDKNGFVYVVDRDNRRVLLLSPALTYVREVLARDQLKCEPQRLFLDETRQQLIVGYRTSSVDAFRAQSQVKRTGRVIVVSI